MTRARIAVFFLTVAALTAGNPALAQGSPQRNVPDRELWVRGDHHWPPARARHYGAREVWSSSLVPGLRRLRFDRAEDRDALLRELRALPGLRYAEPNYRVARDLPRDEPGDETPFDASFGERLLGGYGLPRLGDPYAYLQWALTSPVGLHPEGAWPLTQSSHAVRVAVIDTGAVAQHPDLAPNIVGGYDVIEHTAAFSDENGHGTHVAGIIGAVSDNGIGISGVAGRVGLLPVRAVPVHGDESDADIIEAIEYAVKAGARLANASFGKAESSQAVAEVITAAGERGLTFIVAAGNKGSDLNASRHYPASFRTPNMLVVASLDVDGRLARSSNYGRGRVDLAAPGERILSTWNDLNYGYLSGTSMAAPQVTGVAALMLAVNPQLGVAELRQRLLESVDRAPELAPWVTSGGRLNASRAVQAALHSN